MKFGFLAKHRGIWPVDVLCEALGVSRTRSILAGGRTASARTLVMHATMEDVRPRRDPEA